MKTQIGYVAWVAGVAQFFVAHVIVESAWASPYSWAGNNISDLGNAHCAMQSEPELRYICSPEHGLMNASFITLGTLLVVGVFLTGAVWRGGATALVARWLLACGGMGFVLAGLAPADVHENLHVLGALLIMAMGNIGLVLAGVGLADDVPGPLRWATSLLGVIAIAAFGLFLSHRYLGLGMGGMERVAAFPLLVWALAAGVRGLFHQATHMQDAPPRRHGAQASRS
ncbi:DUF998 domain-containing protein [Streptomyces sp. NPDC052101]|uniref:DUF998 domain-containing protein n=1 Tax=Streptomyces sp. NPDC052101 TaxID=3155763 RepID=UPI0034210483